MSVERHQRLKRLFHELLELPLDQREAFLAKHCAGDQETRDELLAMLRADGTDHELLDGSPTGRVRELEPGGQLDGKFTVIEVVGEGGLGEVWRAKQSDPVRREVAIKVVKQGMDTRRVLARFDQERQTLAILQHPNIARVFDAGRTDGGRPYFVMEFIRGEPITSYADHHGLDLGQRLQLFLDVCSAVQHAHQRGVIHRDLKPSNVLVGIVDDHPVVKVIDFGIAKAIDADDATASMLTLEHQMVGTPAYMSPEQAAGSTDVDTRSDVYALGVLLYELLTGSAPITVDVHSGSGLVGMVQAILEREPDRPSTRAAARPEGAAVTRVRPERLRGDLDWIVLRALEKDRERRYPSAEAFAEDLQRHLRHEPVAAGPPSVRYRAGKFVRRNRLAVGAAAVVLVAVTAAFFGVVEARDRALESEAAALEDAREARESLAEAETVTNFIANLLGSADADELGRDVRVLDVLRAADQEIGDSFAGEPRLEIRLRRTIGITLRRLGMMDEAEAYLVRTLDLARDTYPPDHPAFLEALHSMAVLYDELGRFEDSEPLHRELLARYPVVHGPDSRRTLGARCNFGLFLFDLRRFEEAEVQLRSTLDDMQRVMEDDDVYLLSCAQGLGTTLNELGSHDEALELFALVRERSAAHNDGHHPITINALVNESVALHARGELDAALAKVEDALRRAEVAHPPEHWRHGVLLDQRGAIHRSAGRPGPAEADFERALAILTAGLGADHPLTLSTKARRDE